MSVACDGRRRRRRRVNPFGVSHVDRVVRRTTGVRGARATDCGAGRRQLAEELRQTETAAKNHGRRHRAFAQRHAVRTGAVQRPERVYGVRQLNQVPGRRNGTFVLCHQQVHRVHTERPGLSRRYTICSSPCALLGGGAGGRVVHSPQHGPFL